jgi:acyl carrier protein
VDDIKREVKEFILKTYLPGARPEELTDSTPLLTGGILDSLATLQLVQYLEERYQIEFKAHEVNVDYLNTISDIANFVQAKQAASGKR